MSSREAPPSAVTTACPECAGETLHTVLHGTVGTRGAFSLDATVQCTECGRVHHAVVKEAPEVEVPVVLSRGGESRRTRIALPGDEDVAVDELVIVDGLNAKLTGIEAKDGRRVEGARADEVKTLWAKEFEEIAVGFAINMDRKTITKVLPAKPEDEFTVGQEFVFGRLRVTVHAIKIEGRLLKRGSAEAGEIIRVFAKPTPLAPRKPRPEKRVREQMREREERR